MYREGLSILLFKLKIISLTIPLLLFLHSCGFQTLYKVDSLSGFIIEKPENSSKNHTSIYNKLNSIFVPNSSNDNLIVSFEVDEQYEDIDVREDEKVLRKNIVITVKFNIRREKLNKIIFSGESLISSAFNRVAEPYSNYVNEQDTRERIILLIAKDIQRQLILFKNRKKYNEG